MSTAEDHWNYHPENQVREIITHADGSQSERMYFPAAVCPTFSYRALATTEDN